MRFEGKTAVITAAGAGIGRAKTNILVSEGATVVAVEVDKARLDKMVSDLAGAAGTVDERRVDVSGASATPRKRQSAPGGRPPLGSRDSDCIGVSGQPVARTTSLR